MSSDLAISVRGLSKQYRIGSERQLHGTLRDRLADAARGGITRLRGRAPQRQPANTFWALEDVSLDIRRGEIVGLIGANGAGKSTLLKILSRITEPTRGEATLFGRVGSLLEVGSGFHPELTGRENIFLNGAILGMSRREIAAKFDAIVDFAEVSRFIDTPVRHYSSGMYLRLAFAVAAHLDPDILILDEVLAVGDAAFQRKCLGRLETLGRGEGRTLILVSHNLATVQALCTTGHLLEGGRLVASGPIDRVLGRYRAAMAGSGQHRVRTDRLQWLGLANAAAIESIDPADDLALDLEFLAGPLPFHELCVHIELVNARGERVVHLKSEQMIDALPVSAGEHFRVSFAIDAPRLAPGSYTLTVWACDRDGVWLWIEDLPVCSVSAASDFGRLPLLPDLKGTVVPRFTVRCERFAPEPCPSSVS